MFTIENEGKAMAEQEPLLRRREVATMVGVDPTTIANWVDDEKFPAPIFLNPDKKRSLIAWRQRKVLAW
jgi:predicted DNA-binding transcriptional regulator AlpA